MAGAIHARSGSLNKASGCRSNQGYRDALAAGGKAFILAEDHRWLRLLALGKLRDPVQFWNKLGHLSPYAANLPEEARKLLESSLPSAREGYLLKRRIAGLGSLGHPRILALSRWRGAFISREAKAIRPSAWVWAKKASSREIYCDKLVQRSIRVPDPCVRFHGRRVVRRLAPDCSRIELASLSKDRDEARLLYSMGWETANMQFATPQAIAKVKHDLASRGAAGSIKPQRPCWRQPKKTGKSGSAIGSVPRRVRRSRKTCPHL